MKTAGCPCYTLLMAVSIGGGGVDGGWCHSHERTERISELSHCVQLWTSKPHLFWAHEYSFFGEFKNTQKGLQLQK